MRSVQSLHSRTGGPAERAQVSDPQRGQERVLDQRSSRRRVDPVQDAVLVERAVDGYGQRAAEVRIADPRELQPAAALGVAQALGGQHRRHRRERFDRRGDIRGSKAVQPQSTDRFAHDEPAGHQPVQVPARRGRGHARDLGQFTRRVRETVHHPQQHRGAGRLADRARGGRQVELGCGRPSDPSHRIVRRRPNLSCPRISAMASATITRLLSGTEVAAPIDDRWLADYRPGASTSTDTCASPRTRSSSSPSGTTASASTPIRSGRPRGRFGLIASGWHSAALAMRLLGDHYISAVEAWPRPVSTSCAGRRRCAPETSCGCARPCWRPGRRGRDLIAAWCTRRSSC